MKMLAAVSEVKNKPHIFRKKVFTIEKKPLQKLLWISFLNCLIVFWDFSILLL